MRTEQLTELQLELANRPPQEVLRAAHRLFGDAAAISFSGAEDVVLLAMMREEGLNFRVFTLDTGRLHPQTYQFLEKVRHTYAIDLEVLHPDARELTAFVRQKGLFSFLQDGHTQCCSIRKVAPLKQILATVPAWITGQRRDQSPDTRAEVPLVQLDRAFATEDQPLLKFNPLANWPSQRVWSFIRAAEVPYNGLHEQGFVSIGCEPCTRAILPGEHERAGRWSWEESTKKECGLHASPQK